MAAVEVWINDVDVTAFAVEGKSSRRLNRPSTASVRVPMDRFFDAGGTMPVGDTGDLLRIYFETTTQTVLHHHGRILNREVDSGEDDSTAYVQLNSADPMELWQWRPARDADGDFSNPQFIDTQVTGPQIMEYILENSQDPGGDPSTTEGPLFLELGFFEAGGVSLRGAPTDWPMTIAEIAALLSDSGELDIIITPIEMGTGINYGRVDCYNGDYGLDRTAEVLFQYAFGANNVRRIRWNRDMTQMCNKLWYYLGPRVGTSADPEALQHWRANVTGTDPGLADPPQTDILARRAASQDDYGVRMQIQIFDAFGEEGSSARELYRRLWQAEQWIRSLPRDMVHITPTRDTEILTFDIGDLVSVELDERVLGGISGAQRVYGYSVGWEEDNVVFVDGLQTSAGAEGME